MSAKKKNISWLRRGRIVLAICSFVMLTMLFVGLSGTEMFAFLAKAQFVPALLAANVAVVVGVLLVTLIFGRIYCSVLCPLGLLQDLFNWLTKRLGGKKMARRFSYSAPKTILRYGILVLFVLALIFGAAGIAALVEPYSAFGRIMTDLMQPAAIGLNNLLASIFGDAFGREPYVLINALALSVSIVTFVLVAVLACRSGRTCCNTVCPVGTALGLAAKVAPFKVRIDESKCVECGLCGKMCKSSCIDTKNKKIDYSRCVDCFDCVENCSVGAIKFCTPSGVAKGEAKSVAPKSDKNEPQQPAKQSADNAESGVEDASRRRFISTMVATGVAVPSLWASRKVDDAVAAVTDKRPSERKVAVSPFGSLSHENLNKHCTGCHLCISKCPNNVLRPAVGEYGLAGIMQPVMDFSRGYCDYDCTLCADVCPTGAIKHISLDEKQGIQVGVAVFNKDLCVVGESDYPCGNCSAHCPAGAIQMVPDYNAPLSQPRGNQRYKLFPKVEEALCIGCGACEYHCPAKPFTAIHVEGLEEHKE